MPKVKLVDENRKTLVEIEITNLMIYDAAILLFEGEYFVFASERSIRNNMFVRSKPPLVVTL